MWAVLKLLTENSFETPFGPVRFAKEIAGYIPVYKSRKKAVEAAGDKYSIVEIKEVKKHV